MMRDSSSVYFTLIVATVGRTEELKRLLLSLNCQTNRDFELLLVDQNTDNRIPDLLEQLQPAFRYRRLTSSRGLSRARNVGLQYATGEVIAFPDDDCWYPESFLEQVSQWFAQNQEDFLLCSCRDEKMRLSASRWPNESAPVNRKNILRTCISFGLFVRRAAAKQVGNFDERLGLGAATYYRSGEDTDYGLRLLSAGLRGRYEHNLFLYHPNRKPDASSASIHRAFFYGSGFGQLLRKHHYTHSQVSFHGLRAMGGAIYSLITGRFRDVPFYLSSFCGRLFGYFF